MAFIERRPNEEGIDNAGGYTAVDAPVPGSLASATDDGGATDAGTESPTAYNFFGNADASHIIGNSIGSVTLGFTNVDVSGGKRIKSIQLIARASWGYDGSSHVVQASVGNFTEGQWVADGWGVGSIGNFHGTIRYSWPNGTELTSHANDIQCKLVSGVNSGGFGNLTARFHELAIRAEVLSEPVVDVLGPTGTNPGSTRRPTVTWSPTIGDGYAQNGFQVAVWRTDTGNPLPSWGDTAGLVWWSGIVNGAATSKIIDTTLTNGTYRARVVVAKDFNGQRWWSVSDHADFTISGTPQVPTQVGPTTTQISNRPTLTAHLLPESTFYPFGWPRRVKAIWQVASNSGFSSNLHTITEPAGDLDLGGTHTQQIPNTDALFQGTWFVRARSQDEDGNQSAYSAASTFTISHPPTTTNHSPTGNVFLQYVGSEEFSWTFNSSEPSETQSAYELLIQENDTGDAVFGSTKTETGGGPASTIATVAIDDDYQDVTLRWAVRVWDSDDVSGPFSAWNLFTLGSSPSVTVTAPTGTVTNPAPLVTWDYEPAGGRPQKQYRVQLFHFGSPMLHDSGWLNGDDTEYQPPPVLHNSTEYIARVYVRDTVNFEDVDNETFDTAWTPAATPSDVVVDISTYDAFGYVRITWTDIAREPTFLNYRVYRRVYGTLEWELLNESEDTAASYQFLDYFPRSHETYEWAVVQTVVRFGDNVESIYDPHTHIPDGSFYWLICPSYLQLSLRLHVTGDDYTMEQEFAEQNVIGRGRRVEQGTLWGIRGTLTCHLYDVTETSGLLKTAREQKVGLEAVKKELSDVFIRTPFGDLYRVFAGDIQISRLAGMGDREFATASVPYVEVYEE